MQCSLLSKYQKEEVTMNIIQSTNEYDALLKDNQSVFVDFYADWCGHCTALWNYVNSNTHRIQKW